MLACESGHAACVEALARAKCEQETLDEHRFTGRDLAARRKHDAVIELLDSLGAEDD